MTTYEKPPDGVKIKERLVDKSDGALPGQNSRCMYRYLFINEIGHNGKSYSICLKNEIRVSV